MVRTKEEAQAWKEQLIKDTETKLTTLTTSEQFKDYLKVVRSFHQYSLDNINLIYAQDSNATMVAGFKSWQKLERQVEKGSKAIYIKAPMLVKLTDEEKIKLKTTKDKAIKGYKFVPVFDVKSTSGKELVTAQHFVKDQFTTAETETLAEKAIPKIIKKIEDSYKIPIVIKPLEDNDLGGFYSRTDHSITINSNHSKTQQLGTIFHEFAHSQLHNLEVTKSEELPSPGHREAQAESIAYLSMQAINIDTESKSLGYIATWAKDLDVMKQALSEIKEVFNKTYDIIEKTISNEIKQEKSQTNNIENKEKIGTPFEQANDIQESLDKYAEEHNIELKQDQAQERGI